MKIISFKKCSLKQTTDTKIHFISIDTFHIVNIVSVSFLKRFIKLHGHRNV